MAVQTQPPAGATDAAARKAVSDAFQASMSAMLQKDADGALSHMSDNITFMRLRQTVSRDELKQTLAGSFENADLPSLSEAIELDSIFVQPAESPVEGVTGTVYELNVRSSTDLSSSIPYWSPFQKYYFVEEGGGWMIFAIM
jgi:ketosteroid isomerase-like protein